MLYLFNGVVLFCEIWSTVQHTESTDCAQQNYKSPLASVWQTWMTKYVYIVSRAMSVGLLHMNRIGCTVLRVL